MLHQTQWEQISRWIDERRGAMTEDLRGLVRIRSVSDKTSPVAPFGQGCRDALARMLALGSRDGFFLRDYDGYAGCVPGG